MDLTEELKRQIIRLGEDRTASGLKKTFGAIEDDIELHGQNMMNLIVECVKSFPTRTCYFAAFVSLFNAHHSQWVSLVIEKVSMELQLCMRVVRTTHSQLLLRFLIELANCNTIQPESILDRIETIAKMECHDRDFTVNLALIALPFFSLQFFTDNGPRIKKIIDIGESYIKSRRPVAWKIAASPIWDTELKDRLEGVLDAINSQIEAEWCSKAILRHPLPIESFKGRQQILPELTLMATEMPQVSIRPHVIVRCVESELREHDRFIIEDHFINTIFIFQDDVRECSVQLLQMPFQTDFEKILMNSIFTELFQLIQRSQIPFFYFRLITILCQMQNTCRDHVYDICQWAIQNLEKFDIDMRDVLADYFAQDIVSANFGNVQMLKDASDKDEMWARMVIKKMMGLSFWKNVEAKLPENLNLHRFLPAEAVPINPYTNELCKEDYKVLLNAVRIKDADPGYIEKYIDQRLLKNDNSSGEDDDDDGKEDKENSEMFRMFIYAVLQKGAKTPTHSSRLLHLHKDIFYRYKKKYKFFPELLQTVVFDFWKQSPLRLKKQVIEYQELKLLPTLGVVEKSVESGHSTLVLELLLFQEKQIIRKKEQVDMLFHRCGNIDVETNEIKSMESTLKLSLIAAMKLLGTCQRKWLAFVRQHREALRNMKDMLTECRPPNVEKEVDNALTC